MHQSSTAEMLLAFAADQAEAAIGQLGRAESERGQAFYGEVDGLPPATSLVGITENPE